MSFMIGFTYEPDEYPGDDPTIPAAVGRIVAGELDENFLSNLYEGDKLAYQSQWLSSLERFLAGDEKAVLITWYLSREKSSNIEWWALYRGQAGIVHVQNHLPWYDNLDPEFCVEQASSFLQNRIVVNEDGNYLSEWDVTLNENRAFHRTAQTAKCGFYVARSTVGAATVVMSCANLRVLVGRPLTRQVRG